MRYAILFVTALAIGPVADAMAKGWGGAGADSWQSGNGGQQAGNPGNAGGQGGGGALAGGGGGGAGGQGGSAQGGSAAALAAGGAGGYSDSNSGENTYSNTYNEAKVDQTYRKYTPSPAAPSMGSTTPCLIGISGSLGVPGLAIAGGGGIIDPSCVRGEAIRRGLSGDATSQAMANELIQAELQRLIDNEDMPVVAPRGLKTSDSTGFDWSQLGG